MTTTTLKTILISFFLLAQQHATPTPAATPNPTSGGASPLPFSPNWSDFTAYGPAGLIVGTLLFVAQMIYKEKKEKDRKQAELNDTLVTSIKNRDAQHEKALTDISETIARQSALIEQIARSLADLHRDQRMGSVFTASLGRIVAAKGENRKGAFSEREIGDIIKSIREEYHL